MPPPTADAYENFAENRAYALVRVSNGGGGSSSITTYENVVPEEEQYEPIETPSEPPSNNVQINACYESIEQPSYENVDDQPSYENLDLPSYENVEDPPRYENLEEPRPVVAAVADQQGYENLEQSRYENVGETQDAPKLAIVEPIDVDNETYENVNLGQPSARKAMEMVNVYEDVIPPPPQTAETEEVIYNQVKVLRRSIQEVNELLRQDPTMLQTTLAASPAVSPSSPVKCQPSSPVVVVAHQPPKVTTVVDNEASKKKKSIEKDFRETKKLEYVIREIAVDDLPTKPPVVKEDVRLSLSPKRMSMGQPPSSSSVSSSSAPEAPGKDLSLSLPSLLNSSNNKKSTSTSAVSHSLPPTPSHQPIVRPENDSVSSKRRFESEIGRDLLRERRIRNEIESSRQLPLPTNGTPARRQSTPESPTAKLLGGKPALPIKTSPKKLSVELKKPGEVMRPTTLETSFDYNPNPVRRASSPPSSGSPLSPVSPSSEGRNFVPPGLRKTSVKELLNKFQTGSSGGDNNVNSSGSSNSDRSPLRVGSSPTSPVKPSPIVVSPVEESPPKKVIKDKENIEVVLTPSPPKTASTSLESSSESPLHAVDNNSNSDSLSSRDSSLEDHSSKDLLRQKAPGIDMTDPRTRLRIERYKVKCVGSLHFIFLDLT